MAHTLTIVSHTHWDREWYQPFQEYRIRLVQLTDRLLKLLDQDPGYRCFTFDGQTSMLEDYLEVRPECEGALRRYVQEGRLLIGPWHILPDEFLVGPEATIRNLMLGDKVALRFGPKMHVGYIPDSFGHISQLPQILRGFGLDVAVIWRGVGKAPNEFRWAAPDGTKVLVIHLRDSYGNAAHLPDDKEGFVTRLEEIVASLAPHATTPHLLAMNGTDHLEPMPELPRLIAAARLPDVEVRHGTLPQFIAAVRAAEPHLELRQGELRSAERAHLLPAVFSARVWIKQRNAHCEVLLEKWAEPFAAFALQHGLETPTRDLPALTWQAWRYLIQNHPHDSICGCSVDAVHKEMDVRFDWVEQIGEEVTRQSLEAIAGAVETTALDGWPVIVFNPIAGPRTDVVTIQLSVPPDTRAVEAVNEHGKVVPCQVIGRELAEAEVMFVARDVPGHGYRAFAIRPASQTTSRAAPVAGHRMENEFYAVEADADTGTLAVTDKVTGMVFPGLQRFVDGGDRGDEYNYCPPERDSLVTAPTVSPAVRLVESGPVRWTLEIAQTYRLPASLGVDRTERSDDMVDLSIISRVSLSPGVRRIDFVTTVENHVRDHRLRVHFPTPIRTDVSHGEGHFDVLTRLLEIPQHTEDWLEQPVPTHHQRTFVDVNDGQVGLLVANCGLPEYEVVPGDEGVTVALTLLRCVGWLSRDDMHCRRGHAGPGLPTPGAQCIGRQAFEYALVPHGGGWEDAYTQAHAFNAPLRAIAVPASDGPLPSSLSFVQATPSDFVITTVKLAKDGDGLIVRGYNITDTAQEVVLKLDHPFRRARRVNLNEDPQEELVTGGDAVRFLARAKQIITLRFET